MITIEEGKAYEKKINGSNFNGDGGDGAVVHRMRARRDDLTGAPVPDAYVMGRFRRRVRP